MTRENIDTDNKMTPHRKKRDVNNMPDRYKGYKISSPWTTPWENVGWSLAGFFTGVGTTIALNKINGLAWQVLSLENDTAHALGIISDELKKMREAVIQNRLVLDMLTSERGGVCRMLDVSCCFHIPDNSDNITNIINHMRESIPEPKRDESWFGWLDSLWGGWGTWIFNTVIPIVVLMLILLLIAPCLLRCISSFTMRSITAITSRDTYQVMLNVQHTQTFSRPTAVQPNEHEFDDDTDASDCDYARVYEL
ncbi:Syncytin-A [Anabarilius grahami]|uniref:Syncytin-A n=1 Tax=Anabarilius grahami TaxID=495550 RepID=A0A3N0Y734_ANAGA|nr:Syncytin-A [Anabarilius grahami]